MCKQTLSSLSGSYLFQLQVLHMKLQKTKVSTDPFLQPVSCLKVKVHTIMIEDKPVVIPGVCGHVAASPKTPMRKVIMATLTQFATFTANIINTLPKLSSVKCFGRNSVQ